MAVEHQSIRLGRSLNVLSPFEVASRWIFQPEPSTGFNHHYHPMADLAYCVTPWLGRQTSGAGILNLLPITYANWPRLRDRLTPGGRTFPGKSWVFGGQDSHLAYRYSCPHNHFHTVHGRFPSRFTPVWNAPLPIRLRVFRSIGIRFSPVHFRRETTWLVSCYALFKWWLPLSQHPSCLSNLTSLST